MRIKIKFSKNTVDVPLNNQHLVNSYIHKCLGNNNKYHDTKSDYNISHLLGYVLNSDGKTLSYPNGSFLIVSSLNSEFISTLLTGLFLNTDFHSGMKFESIEHITEKFYDGWNNFDTLSPFLIKEYSSKKEYKFLTLNDNNFQLKVKNYLINKLSKIDSTLDLRDFDVKIPNHPSHKVKKIMVKNVINKGNRCFLNIFCNKRVAETLYNYGIGQSTGSGFGTIFKTENKDLYY